MCVVHYLVQCTTKEKNNLACISVITTWPRYHLCVCVGGGGGVSWIQNKKVLAGGTMLELDAPWLNMLYMPLLINTYSMK